MDGDRQTTGESAWQYAPEGAGVPGAEQFDGMPPQNAGFEEPAITWTASEFVAHHKTSGWYGLLAVGSVVAAALVWVITKDVVSSVVILLAALAFGFYGSRQPRELQYSLDSKGLRIGQRYYPLSGFRSFSVMQEGAVSSIVFTPFKRFSPLTSAYYDPADEEKIIAILSERLPLEPRKHDPIDRLLWRIRF